MKTIITFLVWLLCLLTGGASVGDSPRASADEATAESKAAARKAFERGMAYYQKDDFDKAIEQWETGYQLIPQPVFLYNIGQAHRLSNRPDRALEFYRRYLKDSPDAKNRPEVEERVRALEAQQAANMKLPELYVPPGADGPEPPPALSALGLGDDATASAASQRRRKLLPIVLGAAGGAILLGVVIGLGVYFGTRASPPAVFTPVTP